MKSTPRRRRIPVWARMAILVALAFFAYQQYGYWSIPATGRAAGAGLRASAAYADPTEPDVIDLARARQVIGDRPILMAVLPAGYPKRALAACEDVAKQHPKTWSSPTRALRRRRSALVRDFPAPPPRASASTPGSFG